MEDISFETWGVMFLIGGIIFLFGIALIFWGKREEGNYYDSLTTRFDLREFFSRWPPRPQPGALIAGGWIGIVVGIVLAGLASLIYWMQNR